MPASGYGPQAFSLSYPPTSGRPASVIAANAQLTRYKAGGATIDWTTVAPALADTTDALTGNIVKVGQKVIRFGTVICKLANGKYGPFSAAPAATTLNGAVIVGQTVIPVTLGTGINPGDTLTLAAAGFTAEDVIVQSVFGNTVTLQVGTLFQHNTAGAVTPHNDVGRTALTRGQCFIMDHTLIQGQDLGSDYASNVFDGGCTCYLERIASDFGIQGVPANPTRAQLETGFPGLDWLIN